MKNYGFHGLTMDSSWTHHGLTPKKNAFFTLQMISHLQ